MGEDFAGKYIPRFAKEIDSFIAKGGALKLQALFIGNPYGTMQKVNSYKTARALSIIDESNSGQLTILQERCLNASQFNATLGPDACEEMLDYISNVGGEVSENDGRKSTADWDALIDGYIAYLTTSAMTADIYKALHIDGSVKSQIFQPYNDLVRTAQLAEINKDYTQWYDWLIQKQYPTLIFVGEWDQSDGPYSVRSMLKNSRYLGNKIWEDTRKIYLVNSTT